VFLQNIAVGTPNDNILFQQKPLKIDIYSYSE